MWAEPFWNAISNEERARRVSPPSRTIGRRMRGRLIRGASGSFTRLFPDLFLTFFQLFSDHLGIIWDHLGVIRDPSPLTLIRKCGVLWYSLKTCFRR